MGAAEVCPAVLGGQDLLESQIAPPAVGEVVDEPLANPETETRQPDLPCVVAEADTAQVDDALLDAVDHETVSRGQVVDGSRCAIAGLGAEAGSLAHALRAEPGGRGRTRPLRNLAVGALHTAGRTKIAASLRWISRDPTRTLHIFSQPT